jgi:hypothetical protein
VSEHVGDQWHTYKYVYKRACSYWTKQRWYTERRRIAQNHGCNCAEVKYVCVDAAGKRGCIVQGRLGRVFPCEE